MAISIYDTTRPSPLSVGGQIGGIFVSAVNTATQWREARRTERLLSELTDRELADVGLTRADIPRVARRGRR